MAITAADVKRLRDLTGAGMMDAKKALTETDGDFDKAVETLRVKGQAKAAKRGAEREATAGLVATAGGALIELNSETDFVAKSEEFVAAANEIAAAATATGPTDAEGLRAASIPGTDKTVGQLVEDLAVKIGEKIELGRVPPTVGVLVEFEGDDAVAARGAAMQIAAMRPAYVSRDEVPEDVVSKEREIAEATAREEGKPAGALPKIVEGRLNGFFKDVCLLDQPSVTDSKKSVAKVLDEAGVKITRFARFEVGA
jgi:elongation factor Ts